MSRKGNSVDNAPIESFFGHFKDEVDYDKLSYSELEKITKEYTREYNEERVQWNRKQMTPLEYREYLLKESMKKEKKLEKSIFHQVSKVSNILLKFINFDKLNK